MPDEPTVLPSGVAVLGSTGSVGRTAVSVAAELGIPIRALAGGANVALLAEQVGRFEPELVCVARAEHVLLLQQKFGGPGLTTAPRIVWGEAGLGDVVALPSVDTVVMALPSAAGLQGALAVVESSFTAALQQTYSVLGEKGVIELPHNAYIPWGESANFLRRDPNAEEGEIIRVPNPDQYRLMIEHFEEAVLGGGELIYAPEESIKQMQVLDALAQSARSGKVIELDQVG